MIPLSKQIHSLKVNQLMRSLTKFSTPLSVRCLSTNRLTEVPESVETLIVGGGAVGVGLAYHLAKLNHQVLLLEKSELTAGSTWHAAGLTTAYHPLVNLKRLHWYSTNFFAQIQKETGLSIGYHQPGSIRLATTPLRMDEMRYQISRQGWNDAPMSLVTPDRIKAMVPLIDIDGAQVLGGLYTPMDGHVDPYSLTQAMAVAGRQHGAQIVKNCEVSKMSLSEDGSWNVLTSNGTIRAKRVVNASGFWAKQVAKTHGLSLPLVPVEHQYLVTKSIPDVKALEHEIPVLRHLEASFYLRQERDGLLIGPYESMATMKLRQDWADCDVPKDFGKELFPPDLDRLQPHLEVAMEAVPCFKSAEIQSVINGPITYTPDGLPLVGPTILPNMWLAVGFGYGIIHSAGVGKFLSDWIVKGEPEFDLSECDPDRFGKWCTREFTSAKVRETYGLNNAVAFPNEERQAGRPSVRLSMIHENLIKAGAFMGYHSGWENPDWFSSNGTTPEYLPSFYKTNWHDAVLREYQNVTTNVGIIDQTPFAKFMIQGPESETFLNHLLAGKVPTSQGRTSVAHALTNEAKVYSEMTVTKLDDLKPKYLVVTGSGSEGHDLRHIKQVALEMRSQVEIKNVTDDLGVLGIAGPKAGDLLRECIDESGVDWNFLDAKECHIDGAHLIAIRISYTGELGWELYIPKADVKKVYLKLLDAGRSFGLGHFGNHTLNTLRLEKGFKLWGKEMNMDVDPIQADLTSFIQWNKDFRGKERLLEKKQSCFGNKLAMLQVEVSDAVPEGNETIRIEDKVVGNSTSGCFSPALGQGLIFGYLPPIASTPGLEVTLEVMGQRLKATVLERPPVRTQPVREKMEQRPAEVS